MCISVGTAEILISQLQYLWSLTSGLVQNNTRLHRICAVVCAAQQSGSLAAHSACPDTVWEWSSFDI